MASRLTLLVVAAGLLLLGVACGSGSETPAGPVSITEPLDVVTGNEVLVEGVLVVDGEVRICEALAESFPPQCGGFFLVVRGLDVTEIPGTSEEQGVVWTEAFILLTGTVEDGVLVVEGGGEADVGQSFIVRVSVAQSAASRGLKPGDPIPRALVELRESSMTLGDRPLAEALTDEAGEEVLSVPTPATYMLFATAETEDPLCFWAAGPLAVDVSTPSEVVELEALLACQ